MRHPYPHYAIESMRYVAEQRGWYDEYPIAGGAAASLIASVLASIADAEAPPRTEIIEAAIALVRRRDVNDADWREAAALLAGIAIRSSVAPTPAEQERARDLAEFSGQIRRYFEAGSEHR